jgi:FkbM family methyltransferase
VRPARDALADAVSEIRDPIYLVKGRHGLFLVNRHDHYIGRALMRYGEFSEIEGRSLVAMVEPGATIVDVGANIGAHTVPLAQHVGPSGRVIAIEAQPVIHQQLCANIALNGLFNVIAHACGCGAGNETWHLPGIDYDARRWANFGGIALQRTDGRESSPVPVRPLDDLLGDDIDVDLIKIDVEGMEGEVIAGATRTIARSRPLLYVENDRIENSAALIRQLKALDYRLWWDAPPLFNPNNFFGVAENDYGVVASLNMLCIPAEMDAEITGATVVDDPDWHPLKAGTANKPN